SQLSSVPDQVWSQSSAPACQVVDGDGERSLGGVHRRVGQQPADVLLQLRLPAVDVLQPLSQQAGPVGLSLHSGGLGVLAQDPGLFLDGLSRKVVGAGLLEEAAVSGEPLRRDRGRKLNFGFPQVFGRFCYWHKMQGCPDCFPPPFFFFFF
uniref:Uncharacterized protein n=1 Tax=Hippocampus comes TaxID=109280 RepID=A0A3Q3DNV9_HIPCM